MLRTRRAYSGYGKMAILIAILTYIPLLVLPFYPDELIYAKDFIIPATAALILGVIICALSRQEGPATDFKGNLRHSSLMVLFAWGLGFLTGAIPFLLSGHLNFIQALFEAVSGYTTTGLSVMDVSKTPHIFLFHRSFMQYCGGLGFITMIIMLIHEKHSSNLFGAEGHPDKLMPNIQKTARKICEMFLIFLIAGTIAYILAGMNVFESLLHTMCALSTGGFSTRLGSIGEYNSVPIEIVTIILMLIGTTNFAVLLLAMKRKWRRVAQVSEMRFLAAILLIFMPILTLSLHFQMGFSVSDSLRKALIDGISAISTTGFSSMAYTNWPPFAIGILILLMLIGGGIGSTAGGIKLTRVYLMLRVIVETIRKKVAPARQIRMPYYTRAQGKEALSAPLITETAAFIASYLALFFTGSLLITLTADCTLTEAMFEFSSSIGTVGLSIGITNPDTNNATLIIEILGMFLGRLEIFIIFTGIHSAVTAIKDQVKKNILRIRPSHH